jgi:ABC-2 type transport system ATP-binding protein
MVGLDPQSTRLVKDLMKQYANMGNTVFISTHTLSLAEELCDQIGIINDGKLVACGTLDELKKFAASEGENLESLFLKITGSARPADISFGSNNE